MTNCVSLLSPNPLGLTGFLYNKPFFIMKLAFKPSSCITLPCATLQYLSKHLSYFCISLNFSGELSGIWRNKLGNLSSDNCFALLRIKTALIGTIILSLYSINVVISGFCILPDEGDSMTFNQLLLNHQGCSH